MKLKKLVSEAGIDPSTHFYGNEDKCNNEDVSLTDSPNLTSVSERLTVKMSETKLIEKPGDVNDNCSAAAAKGVSIESPKTILDLKASQSSTDLEDGNEQTDIFHDASENINESDSERTCSLIDKALEKHVTDNGAASSTEDELKCKLSSENKNEDKEATTDSVLPIEEDSLDDSFKEKANEEMMEKDLPQDKN